MRIVDTRNAVRHRRHIQRHIAKANPSAAFAMASRIRARIDDLAVHPHLGRAGRVEGTRELVIAGSAYLVTYRMDGQTVSVPAIRHGARRWPDRFRRRQHGQQASASIAACRSGVTASTSDSLIRRR